MQGPSGPSLDQDQTNIDSPWWSRSRSQKLCQGWDRLVSGLAKMAWVQTGPNFPNTTAGCGCGVLDSEWQIFKWQLSLAPRWVPSCVRALCEYFNIPKSTPLLIGYLSAGYLHTGDLYAQVFPRMNPQVPVQVLVLILSPTPNGPLFSGSNGHQLLYQAFLAHLHLSLSAAGVFGQYTGHSFQCGCYTLNPGAGPDVRSMARR